MGMSTFEALQTLKNAEKLECKKIIANYLSRVASMRYGLPSCYSLERFNYAVQSFNARIFFISLRLFEEAEWTYGQEYEKKCKYHNRRGKLVDELKRNLDKMS